MTLQPKGTQAFGNKNIFVLVSREQDISTRSWASGGRVVAALQQSARRSRIQGRPDTRDNDVVRAYGHAPFIYDLRPLGSLKYDSFYHAARPSIHYFLRSERRGQRILSRRSTRKGPPPRIASESLPSRDVRRARREGSEYTRRSAHEGQLIRFRLRKVLQVLRGARFRSLCAISPGLCTSSGNSSFFLLSNVGHAVFAVGRVNCV
jgi:hypothetical protein